MLTKEEFDALMEPRLKCLQEQFQDRAVFCFPVNLNARGERWDGAVIFGEKGLYSTSVESGEIEAVLLDQIEDARYEAFSGTAACEILVGGEWSVFCRAFSSEKENLSQLIRTLKEVKDGVLNPADATFTYRLTVCPRCYRNLSKATGTCPSCSNKKAPLKKLYALIRPQMGWIVLSILLFFITSALQVLVPKIQGDFVDRYLKAADPSAVLNSFSSALLVVASMAAVRIVIALVSILRNTTLDRISNRTVVELRRLLYEKIQALSVAGISRHTAGDLMNRVSGDTNIIANFITGHLPGLVEQSLMLVFVAVLLFSYSWKLALLVLIPAPFVAVMFRLIWKRNHRLYHRHWVENANANTVLHDVFQGVREVKVYGMEKNEIAKYDNAIFALRNIAVRNETAWAKIVPYADFLIQVGNFILLYFVGNRILDGEMTIGQLTMFSSLVTLIYEPLRWMANLPRIIQRSATAVSNVFEVIDEEPDVADRENALEPDIKGEVRLNGVWFGYTENENVLENVSVSISPGEMLGIVGKSGVGKSTLINLVMRLYDVNRGSITIDGVDVRDISQHSLRSQIGVVLQETFLFAGTVYENLCYAKPNATLEEVMEAARLANAHSFIMKLPDGYDTVVGERGHTLSGGERQRIAIARAILHNPKILILDEATSALDTETEKAIQEALQRLCQNRTTIAIAHRLSTLRNATKLLVLDKKTVAEVGTHEELVAKENGIYQGLVLAQREMNTIRKKTAEKD